MEPERKIEKWLRAFAKKRREQAGEPMELRPATRQLLQREIARQSEEKSHGGSFFNFLFGPRLRLVFAACFTALAIGGWFIWRESAGPQPAQLSMNKTSYPEMAPSAPAPEAPPAVTSPSLANADKKVPEEMVKSVPIAPTPPPATVLSANRAPAETSKAETRAGGRAEGTTTQKQLIVTAAAAPTPSTNTLFAYKNATAAESLARPGAAAKDSEGTISSTPIPQANSFLADALTSNANAQTALAYQKTLAAAPISTNKDLFDLAKTTGAVTVSQVFNRLEVSPTQRRAAGSVAPSAPVLASFRVEQNGNNLKVVDGDGSVYTGSVQIAQQEPASDASFAAARNRPGGAATRSLKADAPTSQSYFFRVAGTNRNLNESVVFSGNFVPYTNGQSVASARSFGVSARGGNGFGGGGGGGGFGGGGAGSDQTASQPIQAVLSNSQINGNVVIGGQKPVDLTATPVH